MHSKNIITCPKCGNRVHRSQGVVLENLEVVCENCSHSTCANCKNCGCAFVEDKSMPDVVMQTIQQGNMTMQQQVKNPEKIRKHCTNCPCFHEEIGCLKPFGKCINYQ